MREFKRDGKSWEAEGKMDGQIMRVTLWPEHRRAIIQAGYKLTWNSPGIVLIDADGIPVALQEYNGRRRVAAVMKIDDDSWIEVEQKR